MFFDDVVRIAQWLGIALGIGAQTVMLVAYLQATRDGIIDKAEAQFARAVRWVLRSGLIIIIASGAASIILDFMEGNASVFSQPAYLFKWALIGIVLLLSILPIQRLILEGLFEGIAGASWYVLFVVHALAPVASWANLFTLYIVWMIGFLLCWIALTYATKEKTNPAAVSAPVKKVAPPAVKPAPEFPFAPKPAPPPLAPKAAPPPKPAPAPVPPPPPKPPPPPSPPKPVALPPVNLPVPQPQHILQTLPQPDAAQKQQTAVVKEEQNPWLPAIQIMPKTPGDAQKQNPK